MNRHQYANNEFDLTCIVLAGGRSSRLGRDKSIEPITGLSLISRVVRGLSILSDKIIVVVSNEQSKQHLRSHTEAEIVVDVHPGKGPLGGIYTGLLHSASSYNLVIACDMPFLNMNLVQYMLDVSSGFDVVMPRIGDRKEPLHAIYTGMCLPPMEMMLKNSNLKVADFPDLVSVRYVEEDEIDRFDPGHLSFFNINTQADLDYARMLALGEMKAMPLLPNLATLAT